MEDDTPVSDADGLSPTHVPAQPGPAEENEEAPRPSAFDLQTNIAGQQDTLNSDGTFRERSRSGPSGSESPKTDEGPPSSDDLSDEGVGFGPSNTGAGAGFGAGVAMGVAAASPGITMTTATGADATTDMAAAVASVGADALGNGAQDGQQTLGQGFGSGPGYGIWNGGGVPALSCS